VFSALFGNVFPKWLYCFTPVSFCHSQPPTANCVHKKLNDPSYSKPSAKLWFPSVKKRCDLVRVTKWPQMKYWWHLYNFVIILKTSKLYTFKE
jgi:hypothetical protein